MNVNIYYIKDYQNFTPLAGQKNKPKTNPILSAVGGFRKRQNRLPENPATFQKTKKNLWTIPKRTIIMISSYKLSISDL